MNDFVFSTDITGCCMFCFKGLFHDPGVVYGFNVICKDCAEKIIEAFPKAEYHCKQCDQVFDSKGKLLAHYRLDHKKEETA